MFILKFQIFQKQIYNLMKFDSYGRFLKSDLYQVGQVNVLFVTINVCLLVLIITLNIKLAKKPRHENVQYMAPSLIVAHY